MDELLPFFVGMLVFGVVVQAGELAHEYVEGRRRALVARLRAAHLVELREWDFGALYLAKGMPVQYERH